MNWRKRFRARIAAAMAAVMVFTVAAPAAPAYADTTVTIKFDPLSGPDFGSTPDAQGYKAWNDNPSRYDEVSSNQYGKRKVYRASGQIDSSGVPQMLKDAPDFSGIALHQPGTTGVDRPEFPDVHDPSLVDWPGYTWVGWREGDPTSGSLIPYLPVRFPHSDVTYYAIWSGNSDEPFDFTVMHYRDLDSTRNSNTDEAAASNAWLDQGSTWNSAAGESSDPNIHAFHMGGLPWKSSVTANQAVSAAPETNIPGYKLQDVLIKRNRKRTYVEQKADTTPGSIKNDGADKNSTTGTVSGSMPNDRLTVAYRYQVDNSQTFPFRVEYVKDDGSNDEIKPADEVLLPAETRIDFTKTVRPPGFPADAKSAPAITAYEYKGAELVTGNTANPDQGVYTLKDAGTKPKAPELTAGLGSNGYQLQTGAGEAGEFHGVMPNQAVTIRYKYHLDPTYTVKVRVEYRDGDATGNPIITTLPQNVEKPVNFVDPYELDIPAPAGYAYPPNITFAPTGNFTAPIAFPTAAYHKFKFKLQNGGGTVTATYNRNTSDGNYWAKVEYGSAGNGTITGTTEAKFFKKGGSYPLDTLVHGINKNAIPAPSGASVSSYYAFKGWYYDSDLDSTGKPKPGKTKLDGSTITLDGNKKLVAVFDEAPNCWYTLKFTAGANGSYTGITQMHVNRDTKWSDVRPADSTVNYDVTKYSFGWYNEANEEMTAAHANDFMRANQTYTAKFTLLCAGGTDDGTLAMPDLSGSVAANGSGTVSVTAPNENRRYALTDADGKVLAVRTGAELQSGAFTGLGVGAQYYVYELPWSENPAPGGNLLTGGSASYVDPNRRSQPGMAVVPALGGNYSVSDDPAATDLMQITVSPTAAATVYAILDASGNPVAQSGAPDGWLTPSGTPGTVSFTGLAPNTTYTVVARPAGGSAAPEDQAFAGSTVPVGAPSAASGASYTLRALNHGYVTEIKRGTQLIAIGSDNTAVTAKAGDRIKISADEYNAAGTDPHHKFKRWEILIGSVSMTNKSIRNQTITMPQSGVILRAIYADDPSYYPSQGVATLDYEPKDGGFALVPEGMEQLRDDLSDNPSDQAILSPPVPTVPGEVAYTVKFDRRAVAASVSDAIKERESYDHLKFPWSVQIGLSRKVNGINKPVPATNSNATVKAYAKIDANHLENMDYKLWKKETNAAGETVYTEVPMTPDPNDADSGFDGSFTFSAEIGDVLVLSYCKAYTVTIVDANPALATHTRKLRVRKGETLKDADNYMSVRGELETNYTDTVSGVEYEFADLRKANPGSHPDAPIYDEDEEVKKDITLYAAYAPLEDNEQKAARKKLKDEIDIAHALSGNGAVSAEDRAELTTAIDTARGVLQKLSPRAMTSELTAAYDTLHALVEEIRKKISGVIPPGPTPPTPPPPPNGGGGGGGGGGRGGVSSVSASAGPGLRSTYRSGNDGSWDNFDSAAHGWAFRLTNGTRLKDQWADIVYTFNGVTRTHTYHFDAEGVMDSGWYKDSQGYWYYLSPVHDGWFGALQRGWHYDEQDKRWYYLSLVNGSMLLGWQEIDGKWYYLAPDNTMPTWMWNSETGRWEYSHNTGRPLGSMYAGEQTPDGYRVDENGAWIRETP
ncbi:MAG: N-acetylmuramoyl-L-alanine amidase family protein [Stomatobaculum sp.]